MAHQTSVVTAWALLAVAANGCLAADYATMVAGLNPIGHWRLGETTGATAADETALSAGTYTNGPILGQAGMAPGDLSPLLDGANDYIEIPHNDAYLLDTGSVSLWFKADVSKTRQELFSKDSTNYDTGGHLTIMLKNSHAEARIQSTTTSYWLASSDFTITDWNHLLLTFGAGGVQLYINGQLEDTNAYTGGLGTSSGGTGNHEPIVIGANTWTSDDLLATPVIDFFDGQIDEVVLLNFVPTPTQISDLASPTGGAPGGIRVVEWSSEPPISSN